MWTTRIDGQRSPRCSVPSAWDFAANDEFSPGPSTEPLHGRIDRELDLMVIAEHSVQQEASTPNRDDEMMRTPDASADPKRQPGPFGVSKRAAGMANSPASR